MSTYRHVLAPIVLVPGRGLGPSTAIESPHPVHEIGAAALLSELLAHDPSTQRHSTHVGDLAAALASAIGVRAADCERLRWAARLHDIGKLHVPAGILNEGGDPGPEGWRRLREHPVEGARLIAPIRAWLGEWGHVVEQHHERWDGSGYPHGLRGREISLGARIVALVDAYDAMTSRRSYNRPLTHRDASLELWRCAGSHFDPAIVTAFIDHRPAPAMHLAA
jgi:putative nucleotidyltransferase with HDIG domain